MRPGEVEFHIEELILDGFGPCDGPAIGAAVEAELARLLGEGGLPQSLLRGGDVPRLAGGTFEVSTASGGHEIGAAVARSVYGGLKR